jgi:hypothetical protein
MVRINPVTGESPAQPVGPLVHAGHGPDDHFPRKGLSLPVHDSHQAAGGSNSIVSIGDENNFLPSDLLFPAGPDKFLCLKEMEEFLASPGTGETGRSGLFYRERPK